MVKALLIKYGNGAAITAAAAFFGGVPMVLKVLLGMMVLDYLSGVMSGFITGKLSSKTGGKGIVKKFFYLVIICAGYLMDIVLGTDLIFVGLCYGFIANELISLLENAGKCGIKVPATLSNAVEILKNKGAGK